MAFPTGWARKCTVTIHPTPVDSLLPVFPLLLTSANLPSEMFDADGSYPAQNGGGDIRFSSDSSGSVQLACEVVSFITDNNPANGSAEIWVCVPSVSASSDTTIYVWYSTAGSDSQPAVTDTYGRNNVWDANFLRVHHASDTLTAGAGTAIDSTGTGNATVDMDGGNITGKIGGGFGGDGAFDEIDYAANLLSGKSAFSAACWARTPSASVPDGTYIFLDGDASTSSTASGRCEARWDTVGFEGGASNVFQAQLKATGGASDVYQSAANTALAQTWQQIVVKWSSGNPISMVIDGVADTPSNSPSALTGTIDLTYGFQWGASRNPGFDGYIDEMWLSDIERSSAFWSSAHSNQNAPGTFATAGTPADAGGGGTTQVTRLGLYGGPRGFSYAGTGGGGGGTAVPVFAHHYRTLARA